MATYTADTQSIHSVISNGNGNVLQNDTMDLTRLLTSSAASSSSLPLDPPTLLASLHSYGLATDLSPMDLSLTLPPSSSSTTQSPSTFTTSSNSSLSILLSRLSLLLSDLSRLLEAQIRQSLPDLLQQTAKVQVLQKGVREISKGISEVDGAIQRMASGTKVGVQRLQRDQKRLKRLYQIHQLLALASRFLLLARRLQGDLSILFDEQDQVTEVADTQDDQKNKEVQLNNRRLQRRREESLVRSARGITSIRTLLSSNRDVGKIAFVASYQPSIAAARSQLLDTMEQFIVLGLRDLSPSLLSSSLLTASMLGVLKDLVRDLMNDLTDVVKKRVEAAFAVNTALGVSADEAGAAAAGYQSYKSRRPPGNPQTTRGTSIHQAQQDFVARLETLFSVEMTAVCSKIYLLQRVLSLMKNTEEVEDASVDVDVAIENQGQLPTVKPAADRGTLLDEGIKILGDRPTLLFWRSLSTALSNSTSTLPLHLSITTSPTLSNEVRRLVDLFFEKTTVWTGIPVVVTGAATTTTTAAAQEKGKGTEELDESKSGSAGIGVGTSTDGTANANAGGNSSAERIFVLRSLGLS